MTDAQLGLMVATPIIIGFAVALRWIGAVRTTGAVTAVLLSVAIAALLFLTQ
ncbi:MULTISPECIES: hypothetical protein [Rhodoplanes]|jgi:hypothetical protein|uniref:Uncharacterized protein n=1 Tax=Rhodoplanes serenus TaxID=200615 RepID=A0A327K061_9BRAD|nr:hypothetical protein [Rhodoplanes serenus]MBI5113423.1 hypothetical protein [Rhodovulum sp.]RAI31203.1 hypothetical protein CH340_19330 [Rhodoplanes serenus]VCU06791.1 hypothetical protein RHODGE_RHODGE_01438 [Rhodoplanes serenus]